MAFTLPTSTLADNYYVISEFDPAVDRPKPGDTPEAELALKDFRDKWKRYLDGAAEPPLRPKATPTVWELKHLTRREGLNIEHEGGQRGAYDGLYLACAYALVGARDLADGDGREVAFERELDKHELSRVKLEILDRLPADVVIELGRIALQKLRTASDPLS